MEGKRLTGNSDAGEISFISTLTLRPVDTMVGKKNGGRMADTDTDVETVRMENLV